MIPYGHIDLGQVWFRQWLVYIDCVWRPHTSVNVHLIAITNFIPWTSSEAYAFNICLAINNILRIKTRFKWHINGIQLWQTLYHDSKVEINKAGVAINYLRMQMHRKSFYNAVKSNCVLAWIIHWNYFFEKIPTFSGTWFNDIIWDHDMRKQFHHGFLLDLITQGWILCMHVQINNYWN